MPTVLVVGGGISGLVASHIFSQYKGVDVKIVEPNKPGGEFAAGGLKYIHRTEEMVSLMNGLGVVFSNHSIRGGILLKGKVEAYPKILQELEKSKAERIRYDHFRKTRRQEPSEFGSRSMNDPEAVGTNRALRCDFNELIDKLAARATFIKARLDRIEPKFITTTGGQSHRYDYLVLTIPMWVIASASYFQLPEGQAMSLNLVSVSVMRDRYAQWDYVYTPYTPGDSIHRFSPSGSGYSCEVNGLLDVAHLDLDLNFIFPDGYAIEDMKQGLKGHLLPLPEAPNWPDNVAPIGRFAKWDPRSTADVVASDAREIANGWGWIQKTSF